MKVLIISLAAITVAGCAAPDPQAARASAERARIELAEAVRGRVPGEPQTCVQLRTIRGNRSAGERAIIFEGPGDTVYVNRPPAGCPELSMGRALVTRTTTSQLCRGDIATVVDPVTGFFHGSCGLGEFVPYRMASR